MSRHSPWWRVQRCSDIWILIASYLHKLFCPWIFNLQDNQIVFVVSHCHIARWHKLNIGCSIPKRSPCQSVFGWDTEPQIAPYIRLHHWAIGVCVNVCEYAHGHGAPVSEGKCGHALYSAPQISITIHQMYKCPWTHRHGNQLATTLIMRKALNRQRIRVSWTETYSLAFMEHKLFSMK